jgi:hypothetical protein
MNNILSNIPFNFDTADIYLNGNADKVLMDFDFTIEHEMFKTPECEVIFYNWIPEIDSVEIRINGLPAFRGVFADENNRQLDITDTTTKYTVRLKPIGTTEADRLNTKQLKLLAKGTNVNTFLKDQLKINSNLDFIMNEDLVIQGDAPIEDTLKLITNTVYPDKQFSLSIPDTGDMLLMPKEIKEIYLTGVIAIVNTLNDKKSVACKFNLGITPGITLKLPNEDKDNTTTPYIAYRVRQEYNCRGVNSGYIMNIFCETEALFKIRQEKELKNKPNSTFEDYDYE